MRVNWKNKIAKLVDWLDLHRLVPVAIAGTLSMMSIGLVFISWLIGYYANALYGMHFDLASCWQGITLGLGSLGGVWGGAWTVWKWYQTDSEYNSKQGETRQRQERDMDAKEVIGDQIKKILK